VFVPLMTPVVVLMMFGPFCAGRTTAARRCAGWRGCAGQRGVGVGTVGMVDHLTWRTDARPVLVVAWVVLASRAHLVADRASAAARQLARRFATALDHRVVVGHVARAPGRRRVHRRRHAGGKGFETRTST
jgi:hypothetical protein